MTQKNLKLDKETKDFAIVLRNVVSEEICKFASTEFKMLETCVGLMHPENAGKEIGLTESFSIYSPLFTETLSLLIQPIVEEAVGKKLFPTYSYGRIYKNGAILSPHLDRMSSEYTISLCLQPDPAHDWQLVIKHLNNTQKCVSLGIGDILIYPGRDLNHWRQGAFKGTEQIQAFIQYVDAAGTSKGLKWDDRPAMGMPWESASNLVHENLDTMLKTLKSAESDDHLSEILPTILQVLTTGTNNES
tara:strand:- start:7786 stop:8523 length:738 start_codon:yes stop_codon:yes gene_type:complete